MLLCNFNYVVKPTGTDSPSQNGAIEIYNGHIAIKVWTLLYISGLHHKFWSAALLYRVYLHNHLVHSVMRKNPFKGHFGVKPDLSSLKLFGTHVCVKLTGKQCSKFDQHNFLGKFLGYLSTNQNICYLDLLSGLAKTSHHAQLDEAWYLWHKQPPGPQLLYGLGLEADVTSLTKQTGHEPASLVVPPPPYT
jgi:hypothetical protein